MVHSSFDVKVLGPYASYQQLSFLKFEHQKQPISLILCLLLRACKDLAQQKQRLSKKNHENKASLRGFKS